MESDPDTLYDTVDATEIPFPIVVKKWRFQLPFPQLVFSPDFERTINSNTVNKVAIHMGVSKNTGTKKMDGL